MQYNEIFAKIMLKKISTTRIKFDLHYFLRLWLDLVPVFTKMYEITFNANNTLNKVLELHLTIRDIFQNQDNFERLRWSKYM